MKKVWKAKNEGREVRNEEGKERRKIKSMEGKKERRRKTRIRKEGKDQG